MKVLEVNNISKRIRKKQILDDVSFFLCAGEIVGLIGKNGVGIIPEYEQLSEEGKATVESAGTIYA